MLYFSIRLLVYYLRAIEIRVDIYDLLLHFSANKLLVCTADCDSLVSSKYPVGTQSILHILFSVMYCVVSGDLH